MENTGLNFHNEYKSEYLILRNVQLKYITCYVLQSTYESSFNYELIPIRELILAKTEYQSSGEKWSIFSTVPYA